MPRNRQQRGRLHAAVNGFEVPVPREIGSGFEASAELWSIDRRRGGIIRAVVGLGKPIELLRCLEESSQRPITVPSRTLSAANRVVVPCRL
jgi:hypothetical protein